jgi:hypothetical protein
MAKKIVKKSQRMLKDVQFKAELPPPEDRNTMSRVQSEALRKKPGTWAVIGSYGTRSSAHGAAFNRRKKWGDEFEIAVRGNDLYARFVGKKRAAKKK